MAGEKDMEMSFGPSKRRRTIWGALLTAVVMLFIGMLGGIWGFLLLSNTTNPNIVKLRQKIGLGDNPAIPSIVAKQVSVTESSGVIDAVKKIEPSVVSVTTTYQTQSMFGYTLSQGTGGGSGFIITSDGYILTNKHVVDGQTAIKVATSDGKQYDGKVVSLDPLNDLAVIKIEAKDLKAVELGDSDKLELGQTVIAVGNPYGEFNNTVTTGVVSAKNRTLQAGSEVSGQSESLTGLLQTDAAINPGNSGGPLVNIDGQVIGITTAIASSSGANTGVGFAIPSNAFRSVVESTQQYGRIIRPGLGVRYIPVTAALAQANSLTVQHGALIANGELAADIGVVAGSPADKAGLKEGDILLSINNEDITTDNPIPQILSKYKVGDKVTIVYQRAGKQSSVQVALEELKQ